LASSLPASLPGELSSMLHKQASGAIDNPPMKAARIKKLRVFVLPMGRSESQDQGRVYTDFRDCKRVDDEGYVIRRKRERGWKAHATQFA
jgi:hypothetical protein